MQTLHFPKIKYCPPVKSTWTWLTELSFYHTVWLNVIHYLKRIILLHICCPFAPRVFLEEYICISAIFSGYIFSTVYEQ